MLLRCLYAIGSITAQKPRPVGYVEEPYALREHLKKRRLDLGLPQIEAAKYFQVEEETYHNWENSNTMPRVRYNPAIILFLGYNPFFKDVKGLSFASKLGWYRIQCGLSYRRLGKLLQIDPDYLAAYAKGKKAPSLEKQLKIEAWFASIS